VGGRREGVGGQWGEGVVVREVKRNRALRGGGGKVGGVGRMKEGVGGRGG